MNAKSEEAQRWLGSANKIIKELHDELRKYPTVPTCRKCGWPLQQTYNYCPKCGKKRKENK